VHGDIKAGDVRQAWRREAVLQRARQLLGTVLVRERRASKRSLTLQVIGEQLTITSCLRAVSRSGATVLGSQFALLGRQHAALRRALTLPAGAHDRVRAAHRTGVVVTLRRSVELLHRVIALISAPVALQRRPIAQIRAHVTLLGDAQARAGGPVALVGTLLTLVCRALASVLAELMRAGIGPMLEIAVAGDLIAISSDLVLVGARLITVRARLIGV